MSINRMAIRGMCCSVVVAAMLIATGCGDARGGKRENEEGAPKQQAVRSVEAREGAKIEGGSFDALIEVGHYALIDSVLIGGGENDEDGDEQPEYGRTCDGQLVEITLNIDNRSTDTDLRRDDDLRNLILLEGDDERLYRATYNASEEGIARENSDEIEYVFAVPLASADSLRIRLATDDERVALNAEDDKTGMDSEDIRRDYKTVDLDKYISITRFSSTNGQESNGDAEIDKGADRARLCRAARLLAIATFADDSEKLEANARDEGYPLTKYATEFDPASFKWHPRDGDRESAPIGPSVDVDGVTIWEGNFGLGCLPTDDPACKSIRDNQFEVA